MTDEQKVGPNVRRVAYVDHVSDITVRISEQADGQWAARADSGRWLQAHIEYGVDGEAAAGAILAWLETTDEDVPEPPDDWWEGR